MNADFGISFIGGGNMAGAIINGILSSGILSKEKISVFDPSIEKCNEFLKNGINVASSNRELASQDTVLVLAVKPQVLDTVLSDIADSINCRCIVSIAAGISTAHIKNLIGNKTPVIRVLPNTPMLVQQGMTVIAKPDDVSSDLFDFVHSVFAAAGEVMVLDESTINEAIPMSSSSPAFFFRMLEAMSNAGESIGLSYEDAFRLSAVAMYGSAKYALESEKTPRELIEQVSSPGGTTIAALSAFDDFDFEKLIFEATKRCVDRAYELGKSSEK